MLKKSLILKAKAGKTKQLAKAQTCNLSLVMSVVHICVFISDTMYSFKFTMEEFSKSCTRVIIYQNVTSDDL